MRDTDTAHPAITMPPSGDDDVDLYRRLLASAPVTSRCPIWFGPAALTYIDHRYAPSDPVGSIDALDAATVLARWTPAPCPPGCPCGDPVPAPWPDLVRAGGPSRAAAAATSEAVADFAEAGADMAALAVVEAARPADIPAVVGWTGAVNYRHQDLASLGAVLRSWEDRFGAMLTWLSGATLLLAVSEPPTSTAESERVALEHFAFCPDQRDPQTGRDPFTVATYARTIRGTAFWRFWWD